MRFESYYGLRPPISGIPFEPDLLRLQELLYGEVDISGDSVQQDW
jgi:hypothetical protein